MSGNNDQGSSGQDSGAAAGSLPPSAPLTGEEKAWLNLHWGGEFHFLQAHTMSIYKEDDREEGRAIVRAMMPHDR